MAIRAVTSSKCFVHNQSIFKFCFKLYKDDARSTIRYILYKCMCVCMLMCVCACSYVTIIIIIYHGALSFHLTVYIFNITFPVSGSPLFVHIYSYNTDSTSFILFYIDNDMFMTLLNRRV